MNEKSQAEAERRARLLKSRAERLPDIKKQFEEKHTGFIVISHYARLFELIKPTRTAVIINGKVAIEGGIDLYKRIDKEGYEWLKVEKNIDFKEDENLQKISLGVCGAKR